ncbi:diguanylate cyclase (GGDEF)-like protein [Nitrobacter vulgaris]|jgi:diguanylate cyclase (GGDEF)-like protein|uniref:sensor domain-containing diguanylate cyclase n=1 Tax=Nitrobacter vulgaris TaxID=29421 RepID=UPI00285EAA53|nr:sensor domain-containing diguanylate cyclase [Nitrobacter vulgaris]MDR6304847.1 diguanylate cyclase (GGDEF)-like protein [Nitrobacter vulgaris]
MKDEADHVAALLPAEVRARLYDQALAHACIGVWECELETERLTWTSGVYDIFEHPMGTPLRRASIVELYEDRSRCNMERARAEAIRSGRAMSLDAAIRTWRGERRWIRLSISAVREEDRPVRIFGYKQDITSDRLALESLRRKAETDPLTGLANRSVFQARYREIVGDNLNYGFTSALVLIDLDRFKDLNDTFGHEAGDACLREIGMRLGQAFSNAGLIARLGGDEFALILSAPAAPARIVRLLQETVVILRQPFFWNGLSLRVGASIGVALVGRPHRRRITELFAEADIALYDAKAAGRNRVYLFGDEGRSRSANPEAAA